MSDNKQPNILFFFPDQHRPDWLGSNPNLSLFTPNIESIAANGVSFSNAYCTSPVCAPSRASLASGKEYIKCGVPNNHYNYPLDQPTYYQSLRDAGYTVAGVGKFDLHKDTSNHANLYWGLDGSRLLKEWGFTEGIDNEGKGDGKNAYRHFGRPRGPYLNYLQEKGVAQAYVNEPGDEHHMGAYTTLLPEEAYCDNWLSENGKEFLQKFPQNRPWHLVVNFTGPHPPWDITESMKERWADVDFPLPYDNENQDHEGFLLTRQHYTAMIENIDRQIGEFMELVKERGELENTIVIFASDHGEMLGDHGKWGKQLWYEQSVGIPLIISGPEIMRGKRSSALVSLHDLAATFVDYCQSEPMPEMDTRSLRALLEGRIDTHREFIFAGLDDCNIDNWRMIYNGRYKMVIFDDGPDCLYDLQEDPLENYNIVCKQPHIAETLRQELIDNGMAYRKKMVILQK